MICLGEKIQALRPGQAQGHLSPHHDQQGTEDPAIFYLYKLAPNLLSSMVIRLLLHWLLCLALDHAKLVSAPRILA